MKKLKRSFFERDPVIVAEQLLGKVFSFGSFQGIIYETEAYRGTEDLASHAARGITPRNRVVFGPAGVLYVYFIYGMYHCLNIVTEKPGIPGAVLIRGLEVFEPCPLILNGPGKLCRDLGITRAHNGIDIITSPEVFIACQGHKPSFQTTSRIGIRKALEKQWRFVVQ